MTIFKQILKFALAGVFALTRFTGLVLAYVLQGVAQSNAENDDAGDVTNYNTRANRVNDQGQYYKS